MQRSLAPGVSTWFFKTIKSGALSSGIKRSQTGNHQPASAVGRRNNQNRNPSASFAPETPNLILHCGATAVDLDQVATVNVLSVFESDLAFLHNPRQHERALVLAL